MLSVIYEQQYVQANVECFEFFSLLDLFCIILDANLKVTLHLNCWIHLS